MKKHITMITIILIVIFNSTDQTKAHTPTIDSTSRFVIHFKFDKHEIEKNYMSNSSAIESMDLFLNQSNATETLDSILITAYSSPDGNVDYNLKLSKLRANTLKRYIEAHYPQTKDCFLKTKYLGENWQGLRDIVIHDINMPDKDKVIAIIDAEINPATKEWRLRKLSNGKTWNYISKKHLHKLRSGASCMILYNKTDTTINKEIELINPQATIEIPKDSIIKSQEKFISIHTYDQYNSSSKPLLAIKSNLLYDLATLINAEIEIPIGKRWSISGEYTFPWWQSNSANWTIQLLAGHGAIKYWLGDRNNKSIMTGWNLGVYGGGGKYDMQIFSKNGNQGKFFDAGVQLGYTHEIGRNLRLEYLLCLGYMQAEYKEYEKIRNTQYGDIKVFKYPWQIKQLDWIGPTSAKISLVWLINYKTIR